VTGVNGEWKFKFKILISMHAVVSKGKKQHEKNTWTVVGM
jgi:hypothetical protein